MRKFRKQLIVLFASVVVLSLVNVNSASAFVYEDRVSAAKSLAHYAMGQIYDLLGLTNRAVWEYEEASYFDDKSHLIHLRLGASYARLGFLNKAKDELNLVSKINPEDLQSHYLLALIYSTEKNYEGAAKEYELILKQFSQAEPDNIEIYGYLGQLYYSQKKFQQAINQFEKILEIETENSDIMYLLGSLYLEVGRKQDAINLLKKSIEINPEHDGSLNTLAYLYAESGEKLDEAMSLINRALKISPNNGAYLDSLGWVYYKKGDYNKALEIFLSADAQMKDPVIYDHLGDVYLKLNKIEEAIKYWNKSLELDPTQKIVQEKINNLKNSQASRTVTDSKSN